MVEEKKVPEPSILDDINDESDQAQAISDFRSLVKHNGWRRIVKYYEDVMRYHQAQLNGDGDVQAIKSMSDLSLVRFKRDSAERLTNLPEILIGLIKFESDDIELDPHYVPDDFDDNIGK